MACNFLTRLFHRRQRTPVAFAAPTLPTLDDTSHHSLESLNLQQGTDLLYLGYLAQQGSYTLLIRYIPTKLDTSTLDRQIRCMQGFVTAQYIEEDDRTDAVNLHINFSTAADAAMALADHSTIDLGNGQRRHLQYAEYETDVLEPAHKRIKVKDVPQPLPECQICGETVCEPYSKPCFYCKAAWCYECLKNQFSASLGDHERFPAKCCDAVLHFDVARMVIAEDQLDKYRTRFEEHSMSKPIYCGNARCSKFLPPRLCKPNYIGAVCCPGCGSFTCAECRILVSNNESGSFEHTCTRDDEVNALLQQYGYKRCPRCDGGVAKMYGCSHVRCQCGAHWCWDCQRPVQICWSNPCKRAREDGNETDEHDIPESESDSGEDLTLDDTVSHTVPEGESETPQPTVPHADTLLLGTTDMVLPTPISAPTVENATPINLDSVDAGNDAPTSAPTVQGEAFINLDSEDADDWESPQFQFGEEPVDETWHVWGCMHRFAPVPTISLWLGHKEWLPETKLKMASQEETTVKQIDCMKCYNTVIVTNPGEKSKPADLVEEPNRPGSTCDLSTSNEATNSALIIPAEVKKQRRGRKDRKLGEAPTLYNCPECGVFYCFECKKSACKEIRGQLKKQLRS